MELNIEAKRIMGLSLSKLYNSRMQKGGMRLHKSLMLSLVMRSAREIYYTTKLASSEVEPSRHEASQLVAVSANVPGVGTEDSMEIGEPVVDKDSSGTPVEPLGERSANLPDKTVDCLGERLAATDCDKENSASPPSSSPDRQSRKRRGKATAEPEFLPSKRARMEPLEQLQANNAADDSRLVYEPTATCHSGDRLGSSMGTLVRAIVAF
ncbi:immediate early response 2b [Erpetoichthys calabaricus]|uniref:immediate early response 2b n=1 Tax=Erpetoichthys calabaricus TaxID=27687 RepID=UPI002234020B|nr:immediate early response 2b [Erpetoichthys calabaricus]